MINVFKKIWLFSANEQNKIKKSIVLGLLNAIFNALQLGAIFIVLDALVKGDAKASTAWAALGLMLASILGKIVTQYYSQLQRTHAGYFMVAEKRIRIGDKLKVVPMGYFNRNSMGNITAVATTILSDVENTAPVVLVTILGGFLNAVVFAASIFLFDWRIGLIVLAGMLVFLYVTSLMEKKSCKDAPRRQAAQEALVEAVLETVQGMSVVKAFNLDDEKDKKIDKAIEQSCNNNMILERAMTPYIALQQAVLNMSAVAIMIVSIVLYLNGTMTLVNCLMMQIVSFLVFEQLKSAGSGTALLRITETSIDLANEIDNVPVMDEGGEKVIPASYDIEFENVGFAYEKRCILKNISFKIQERTTTAIIGPSGSGKTTLCNLIARFWDADTGKVSIGGRNVKDYTLESLLSNISMVFQNVYLFNDTIANNIKFGKPAATMEEIIRAAEKACCHDFIMGLPQGYDTIIGEGGATISGGEKQRISIARAMLKDASIIILDEATANVDPESEGELQKAIEELTRNKTIIMIAHRLKTVRNANRILVLDKGKIVQQGTHDELLREKGIYADFIGLRNRSAGWKLKAENAG